MADESQDIQRREPAEAEVVDERARFLPAVDIYETDDGAVLVADLPGCDEESVDVSLEDRVLTIRGRVKPESPEGLELATAEYRTGDFERTFTVSELIDAENIEATVTHGVLRLTLPKAEVAKPRKIEIKAG
ncbi:MAG: Hsp20/alpha crystallin family protein [Planctomycetota bacterium]